MPRQPGESRGTPAPDALAASERRYRDLIRILPDALFVQHAGIVTFANDAAARLFGAPDADALVGREVLSLFDTRYHAVIEQRLQRLRAGEPVPFIEERIRRFDGTLCAVEVAATPFHDPDGSAVQVVLHDFSERRALERELVDITERTALRIGTDLHDGVGQELFATDLALRQLEELARRECPGLQGEITNVRRLIARAVASSRSLARLLAPLSLPTVGLEVALADLAAHMAALHGFRCGFTGAGLAAGAVNDSVAMHLFRIAQEAATNAARHAGAHEVSIRLSFDGERLSLEIEDNGRGIAAQSGAIAGLGLRSMGYRARMIGGNLTVKRKGARGTLVRCELPLTDANPLASSAAGSPRRTA